MKVVQLAVQFIMGLVLTLTIASVSNASETMKGAQKDYETFKQEMSAKLESLDKEIDVIKEKAKQKGTSIKNETLQELEASRAEVKAQMDKMESQSKSKWKSMKKGLSESFDSLHAKIQKALKD